MVTSRAETDSDVAASLPRRSREDEDDSREKREEDFVAEGARPLKSALRRCGEERSYKCVSFNSTVTVYADDAPRGREEPVKGADTLSAFHPPEYEEDSDNGDWDCDWFPVVSVSRLTPEDVDDEDEDSDEWDVLQPGREDEEEEEDNDDDVDSDDSRDTIVLSGPSEESNSDDISLPVPSRDSDVPTAAASEEEEEESRPEDHPSLPECVEWREPEEARSRTSDIRRRMEESWCGRTSLEVTEAKRRQSPVGAGRRASSTECLSEKLRWLVRPETLWDGRVTVPVDVREWKIETSRSDELEQFVAQYLGRIERIRKRYSLTDPGLERHPSVRGIRPRFGSTVEILRRLQSQIRHPTWPPRGTGRHPEAEGRTGPPEERGVPEGSAESFGDEGFIHYSLDV